MAQFNNVTIKDCGTGVSMPANAPVSFNNLVIEGCDRALDLRDPPSLLAAIGLPTDLPPDLLIEALRTVLSRSAEGQQAQSSALSESRFAKYLGHTASAAGILSAVMQIYESGLANRAIEALSAL